MSEPIGLLRLSGPAESFGIEASQVVWMREVRHQDGKVTLSVQLKNNEKIAFDYTASVFDSVAERYEAIVKASRSVRRD